MKKSHWRLYEWLITHQDGFPWGAVPCHEIPFIVQRRTISQMQDEGLIEVTDNYVRAISDETH